jgi:hypothetical protein
MIPPIASTATTAPEGSGTVVISEPGSSMLRETPPVRPPVEVLTAGS